MSIYCILKEKKLFLDKIVKNMSIIVVFELDPDLVLNVRI
jgi:hypothetical protein